MNEENTTNEEELEAASETMHEAHPHARPRLLVGVAAVAVVAIIGAVWMKWSEPIKEFCFGEDGACPVELPDTPGEGGAALFESDWPDEGLAAQPGPEVGDIEEDLPPVPDAPLKKSE